MFPPSVAAIIPVYNRPRFVTEALDSVAAQHRRPARIVVVDDGSTDETPRRLEAWAEEHRRDVAVDLLLRHENRGVAWSRNAGAAAAAGADLIAYLDSDDLWPADYLARAAAAFAGRPEIVAATADRLDWNVSSGRRLLRRFDQLPRSTTLRLFMNGPPGTPNTVFRAAAFHEAGGYDESHSSLEDYELMLRLSRTGGWGYIPGAPVVVRRDLETAPGDAPHLSRQDAAWRVRQGEILERFLREGGGAEVIPERLWRRRLAHVWYRGGRQFQRRGEPARAAECFARALSAEPWHIGARFRRALAGAGLSRRD